MKTEKIMWLAGILLLFGLVTGYHGSVSWTNAILLVSLLAFMIKFFLACWIYFLNPSANVNRYFALVFT
ncbi:hypothetical protein HZB90_01285, partial [archaeon]|nr:hypothetical protein [archaeon]